jgi:2-iminobutanoate/2-iminopropanoate deaminase
MTARPLAVVNMLVIFFCRPLLRPARLRSHGPQVLQPRDAGAPPFSGAVRVGDTLYPSGTNGLDQNQQAPATVEGEAKNVLTNVQNIFKAAGMTMDDLVSVQVFCSDVAHLDAFNAVYRTFFTKEFPTRAFVGSGRLVLGARFEVQGVAVRR